MTLFATDTLGANATLTFPLIVEPDRLAQLLLGIKIGSIALSAITVPLTVYKFRVKAWNWCCQKRHRQSRLEARTGETFTHKFSNPRIQTVRVREIKGKRMNPVKPPGERLANFEDIPEGWEWNRAKNTVSSNTPVTQGQLSQTFYLDGRDKHKRIMESLYVELIDTQQPAQPAGDVTSASIASASGAVELESGESTNE